VTHRENAAESGGSLIIQTSFLGDTVLTTPLIAWLSRSSAVDVVTTPASAALLANSPAIRRVIVYDKRHRDRGVGGFMRIVARLRAAHYETAYLAQGSVRSGALALAARIRTRVGFASSAGRRFYTRRMPFIEDAHHARRLLSLATDVAGIDDGGPRLRPQLYPGDRDRTDVDRLLGSARVTSESLVAFAPGSVWGTKRWPGYADLSILLDEVRPVIVGSADDQPIAAEIVAATNGRAIDATGRLSLLASAELIGRCRALVTNDSAPLHLASAMNTPTVAIFGPTVPEFGFGPLAERHRVLGHTGLACRPCDRHGPQRCPLRHWRCMREITPESVAAIVRDLLVL
jgi:heptosyltransferase-2